MSFDPLPDPRTQAERSAATRAALITAARPLFTERGYAAVGTDEIARAAGVTRGALYHQFAGKEELFVAVFEQIEGELVTRLGAGTIARRPIRPLAHVLVGALEEAALYAARSPDRATATAEVRDALFQFVDGLVARDTAG